MNTRRVIAPALAIAAVASAQLAVPALARAATVESRTDANAQANLRSLAVDEEIYLTDNAKHYASFHQLAEAGQRVDPSPRVTLYIRHLDGANGYCLEATTNRHHHFILDSAGGQKRGSHCIAITHGRSGGVRHHH